MKKYLTVLIIFFASCKKDIVPFVDCGQPTSNLETCKKLIIGKWSWSYERYFNRSNQTFEIKTPITEGYKMEIEFTKLGKAIFYRNSLFEKESTYSITTFDKISNYPADNTITTLIIYDSRNGYVIDYAPVKICTDTLGLNYSFYSDSKGIQKWSKN